MILKVSSRFRHTGHLWAFPLATALFAVEHPFLLVVTGLLLVRLFLYDRAVFLLAVTLVALTVPRLFLPLSPLNEKDMHTGIITRIEQEREFPRLRLQSNTGDFLVYHENVGSFRVGEGLLVEGKAEFPQGPDFFGGFDYASHLRAEGIVGIIHADSLRAACAPLNPHRLRGVVSTYLEEHFPKETRAYVATFVLADRQAFTEAFTEMVAALGVMHLFAVSGLHVSFLALVFHKGVKKLFAGEGVADATLVVFLLVFMFLTAFPPSVVRAGTAAILVVINRRFRLGFSILDILCVIGAAILLVNPFQIRHTGFILTFAVSLSLVMSGPLFRGRPLFIQGLLVSFTAFATTLPVILAMRYEVNLTSIPLNIVYVWFLTVMLLPGSYIVFLAPFLEPVFAYVVTAFEASIVFFHSHARLMVPLHIPAGIAVFAYYALFWLLQKGLLERRGRILRAGCLSLFLTLVFFSPSFTPYAEVTMFSVHGDAFLVRDAFNRCNILIDTGLPDENLSLVNALRRMNLRRLDYVIITHEHADHYGAYPDVAAHFRIEETITNRNQETFEDENIFCGGIVFFIYPLEVEHTGENDRSLVMRLLVADEVYLFTGDIEGPREKTIIEHYYLAADILKVPHHGSATSSSEAFLEAVGASEALIPAHRDNRFGFPAADVLERLHSLDMDIHRVDIEGSIRFRYFFGIRWRQTTH